MLDLRIFTCLITPEVFHVSLKTPTDFFIIIFSNRERIFLNWAQEQENSFAATVSRMMKKQRNRAVYSQSGTRVHTKVFGRPRDILRRHSHTSSVVSFGQWSGTKLRAWHLQRFPETRRISLLLWMSFKHSPRCLRHSLNPFFFPVSTVWSSFLSTWSLLR